MLFLDVINKITLRTANQKRWTLTTACYEIAKRTNDFVMTYIENRTINMPLVMLFLVGNKTNYYIHLKPVRFQHESVYICMCRWMTISICCLYVGFDYAYIDTNERTQGIKSFLVSHVWSEAMSGSRTYDTDSAAIPSRP